MPAALVSLRHGALVHHGAAGVEEVERDGRAARPAVPRAVQPHHRRAAGVLQLGQAVEQPAGQVADPPVDQVDADVADPGQAGGDVGNGEEVERAVLERALVVEQPVPAALHAGAQDRPAGEPRAAQPGQRVPPGQQAAEPGRIAEHLVEAHRHELGPDRAQVEPVGRDERGRVEQHVVARGLGQVHPAERVLDAAEVALRRVGEQPAPPPAAASGSARAAPEGRGHVLAGHPQIGRGQPDVPGRGAAGAGELPDAVHGIVVIHGKHEAGHSPEWICLTDQAARAGGVRREDDRVFGGRSVEIAEHRRPGLLDELGGRAGCRAFRVRVAETPAAQPPGVRAQLRVRGEAGAGVVEVGVPARVEIGVFAGAQVIEPGSSRVVRIGGEKIRHNAPLAAGLHIFHDNPGIIKCALSGRLRAPAPVPRRPPAVPGRPAAAPPVFHRPERSWLPAPAPAHGQWGDGTAARV